MFARLGGALLQRVAQHRDHQLIIGVMRGPRGGDPARGVDLAQIERMAGRGAKLLQKLQLGPAIAFAEGVEKIQIANDPAGFGREIGQGPALTGQSGGYAF